MYLHANRYKISLEGSDVDFGSINSLFVAFSAVVLGAGLSAGVESVRWWIVSNTLSNAGQVPRWTDDSFPCAQKRQVGSRFGNRLYVPILRCVICLKCMYRSLEVMSGEVYMRAMCFHVSESTGSLSPHLSGPFCWRGLDSSFWRAAVMWFTCVLSSGPMHGVHRCDCHPCEISLKTSVYVVVDLRGDAGE